MLDISPAVGLRKKPPFAFTLVELVASLAIVLILVAALVAGVRKFTDGAKKIATMNSMRNIHAAIISYTNDNDGTLPGPVTVQVLNWARDTPLDSDTPHLGAYIGRYLGASISPKFADLRCKALICPALPAGVQANPAIGQYRTWDDYSFLGPDNVFGTFAGSTMANARLVFPRPKRLAALTPSARQMPILSTVDQEILPGISNDYPKKAIFDGKRMWLSIDGNIVLQESNPRLFP